MNLAGVPGRIIQVEAPTSITAIYTNGSNKRLLKEVVLCNTGGASTTFSLAVVPGGETLATKHYLFNDVTLSRKETKMLQMAQMLESGDRVVALAGAAGVSINASGVEFVEVT